MPNLRDTVYSRDQGECSACGLPAGVLDEALKTALDVLAYWHGPWEAKRLVAEMQVEWWGGKPRQSLWEADHIHQQAHDGSDDLENMRTFCVACHAKNTAMQAGEQAFTKRAQHSIPGYDTAHKATRARKKAPNTRMPGVNAPVFTLD